MAVPRVHLVIGTRPEAVKLAPVACALRAAGIVEPVLVVTGQHHRMAEPVLAAFGLQPDVVLRLRRCRGDQAELVAWLAPALDHVLAAGSAAVVVQGDTTSALVGGLVAMWRRIPVVHVEAGLRSGDLTAPFPEEANRRMLGVVADLHLAPTATAVAALAAERAPSERVLLIGNTVVDAAQAAAAAEAVHTDPALGEILRDVAAGRRRLMLVTAHRRESWGAPLRRVLRAVREIVDENPDVWCVLPAHPNPAVRAEVRRALDGHARVRVTRPLPYPVLCRLLRAATVVLTDSGGIQEEAPTFRVPVLVLRDVTERPEAVWSGWAELVGTDDARIVAAAKAVLSGTRRRPDVGNPFGDGHAAERAAQAIAWLLGRADRPQPFAGPTGQPGRPRRAPASGRRAAEPLGGPARGGTA